MKLPPITRIGKIQTLDEDWLGQVPRRGKEKLSPKFGKLAKFREGSVQQRAMRV
jgi:hypothetical protein